MSAGWNVVALDEAEHRRGWIPLRELLDVKAFGLNAWSVESAGDPVIPAHDEADSGHEELYVVVRGHVRFTVGDDELDGPQGTILFVRDPAVRRGAIASRAETIVLTAGAKTGEAYAPRAWEWNSRLFEAYQQGDLERAFAGSVEAREQFPNEWRFPYNMACIDALLGRRDDAIRHLREAYELGADQDALADDDFASLRDDPEFVAVARETGARRQRA